MKKVTNLFVALMAVVVMVSCAGKKSFNALNGEWNVVSVGELVVPDSVDAFLGFDIAEQLVYGCTGCNQLTGALPAEVSPEVPMFAAMGSTRMMCTDMTVEDALLPALGQVVDFKVEGNNLYLLNAEGNTVVSLVKR
ncbi:MAG: META domain-containing protein [Bacteroidaceae bacterium]|nr:META domain-containing protein [Bacteroidaceae bacterium]